MQTTKYINSITGFLDHFMIKYTYGKKFISTPD